RSAGLGIWRATRRLRDGWPGSGSTVTESLARLGGTAARGARISAGERVIGAGTGGFRVDSLVSRVGGISAGCRVIGKMSRVSQPESVLVLDGWTFPTGLAFGPDGVGYLAEAGLPFGGARPAGRAWRLDGTSRSLLADGLRPPVN